MKVNFVLLRNPLAHPDAVVVRRKYGLTQGCPEIFSSHIRATLSTTEGLNPYLELC